MADFAAVYGFVPPAFRDSDQVAMGLAWNAGRVEARRTLMHARAAGFGSPDGLESDMRLMQAAGATERELDRYLSASLRASMKGSPPWP